MAASAPSTLGSVTTDPLLCPIRVYERRPQKFRSAPFESIGAPTETSAGPSVLDREKETYPIMKSRILAATLATVLSSTGAANAAYVKGTNADDVLFGLDDDNRENTQIQPAGAGNQSLDNTDVMKGGTATI